MTSLTAFYDLAVGPLSYDFVVFLTKAELARQKINAERLHVVIVPMPGGVGGLFRPKPQYDEAEGRWRLWNIVIPAAQLYGATVTLAQDWLQAKRIASEKAWKCWPDDWDRQSLKARHHLIGGLITEAKAGAKIPGPKASAFAVAKVRDWAALRGKPLVTMTLRNTYLPERNADPAVWAEAKRAIESRGYAVLVLQDTSVALASGSGYGELNLDIRTACYERAVINLQANNGAASLCWFGAQPYRMFGAGVPAEEWDGLFVKQGLPLGETWPWAKWQQKICYGKTTTEQILTEFDAWASATS